MTWKTRFLVSLIFSLIVGLLSVESTRRNLEQERFTFPHRNITISHIRRIDSEIERYRLKTGHLPVALTDLPGANSQSPAVDTNISSWDLRDGWGRQLMYKQVGDRYVVFSYGEDGKPGGTWLDEDISSDRPFPHGGLSYADFVHVPEFANMLGLAGLTAVAGFFIVCIGIRSDKRVTWQTIVVLGIAGVAAFFMSGIMIVLHVYPEH